jgi:hypothetical protein
MRTLPITLALAIATPAMAQSTVVMPQPGANGYAVVPPRQGFTTQVLPMPGRGWMVVPPGAQGRSTTALPLPGAGSTATAPFSAAQPCCRGSPGQGRARLSCIAGLTTPARGEMGEGPGPEPSRGAFEGGASPG